MGLNTSFTTYICTVRCPFDKKSSSPTLSDAWSNTTTESSDRLTSVVVIILMLF